MPSPNEELFEKQEENDTIRSLQQQLEKVQSELANLQKGFNSWDQSSVTGLGDDRKYNASFVNFVKDPAKDNVDFEETNGQTSQRNCFQTQDDTSRNCDSQAHQLVNVSNKIKMGGTFDRREEKRIIKKGEREDKDEQMTAYKGSMKITEGLRTRSKSKPARTNVIQRNNNYTRTAEVDKDALSIKEKIALLQKRDPTAPKPDKGIAWPKTMLNLSKTDKAYYTEQFMRSELFRQRCLRKYQGGHTWMNGLSPFQIWIVEHEGSEELEAVLHPFPKRRNNAQAKVNCWRETHRHHHQNHLKFVLPILIHQFRFFVFNDVLLISLVMFCTIEGVFLFLWFYINDFRKKDMRDCLNTLQPVFGVIIVFLGYKTTTTCLFNENRQPVHYSV